MKDQVLSSAFVVDCQRSAAILADARKRAMLMLFSGDPRSVAEAAVAGGLDLKRLHHHVGKLCAAGLLRVVGKRRRGGRPIKLYRTVAEAFFVPDELLPAIFTQSLADELRVNLAKHAFRPGRGMLIGRDDKGQARTQRVHGNGEAANVIDLWLLARLTPASLIELRRELQTVLERFAREEAHGTSYLVHAAAAPRG